MRVIRTDEKGSDVNLASYLLLDAFKKDCEAALIISNDSDLVEPIRIARREFGIKVCLGAPRQGLSLALVKEVDFVRRVREGALRASQFPATMRNPNGAFSKPPGW